MTDVLRHAEAMTRHRDQTLVDIALVTSLLNLLGQGARRLAIRLYHVTTVDRFQHVILAAWNEEAVVRHEEREPDPATLPPELLSALDSQEAVIIPATGKRTAHHYWLPAVHDRVTLGCIEIATSRALSQRQRALIEGMRGLYCNYLSLLQYSQVDTLTGLLNRKTFEDSLQKVLAAGECPACLADGKERRGNHHDGDDWLAVLDIDHFKRINDQFGHLFGDEVLILVAGLMRQVFRRRDKLFRFGGEEFIVILRHASEHNALKVFERFRELVAHHSFPQVGQVTVSIGLTRLQPQDSPTTLLGRADEALYYAKHHGRNQLRHYEALLAEGRLAAKTLNTEAELF